MADYVETKVFEAMASHLASLTLSPPLPIVWPNMGAEPSGDYLRVSFSPASINQITLGDTGQNRHAGFMQIDVFTTEGGGATAPLETAGAIAARFKRGTVLTRQGVTIRIIRPPTIDPPLQDAPWLMIPVTVRYSVDAPNPS